MAAAPLDGGLHTVSNLNGRPEPVPRTRKVNEGSKYKTTSDRLRSGKIPNGGNFCVIQA
jgi:hypothetical protein